MTESGLENYGDSITAAGKTFIVIHSKNIVGFQAYNNLTYDVSNKSFYIIPGYTLEQLNQKIKNNEYQELFSLLVGGYAFQGNQILEGSVVETRFVATSKVIAPNVRIFESGKEVQSQVGFNPTNRMNDLQKYDLTLNSGSEYKFITGGEDNTSSTYVTAETLTFQMPVFTKLASANVYSSVGEKTTGNGDKLYVAEWYDNAELSGQPISLPYTLSKDTTLYAKWEYNCKEYTIAPTAKNVELWVRGRKVLKVKDLSAFLGEKDTMETCYEFVASNGDVYGAVVNFKESESLEYVDKNFKMMAVIFFSCQFYTQDWNVFEWSDVNQDSILTCVDTFFSMGQNNNVIEISMGHYDGLDCLKDDDLKVYVDGVEANYTWTRCVYD